MRWLTTRLAALTVLAGTMASASAQRPVSPTPAVPSMPAPAVPGGGPGGPGGGMRFQGGPGGPDADTIWGFMSQGSDTIDVNKRPEMRSRLERSGVTIPANGIVSKAAFKEGFDKRRAEREAARAAGGGPGGYPGGAPPVVVEAPPPVFVPPQPEQPQPVPGGSPGGKSKKDETPDKPFVSRFGNLPPQVPDYFVKYDDDEDGMIGLYEWRRYKQLIAEFVKMDLNGDGLLTPDEYVRFKNAEIAKTPDGKGKDTASRDRRETRSGNRNDARGKDNTPIRPTTPNGERPARGQRPDDKSSDRPASAAAPRNPFTGK